MVTRQCLLSMDGHGQALDGHRAVLIKSITVNASRPVYIRNDCEHDNYTMLNKSAVPTVASVHAIPTLSRSRGCHSSNGQKPLRTLTNGTSQKACNLSYHCLPCTSKQLSICEVTQIHTKNSRDNAVQIRTTLNRQQCQRALIAHNGANDAPYTDIRGTLSPPPPTKKKNGRFVRCAA